MNDDIENLLFSRIHDVFPKCIPSRRVSHFPTPIAGSLPSDVIEDRRVPRQDSKDKPVGVTRAVPAPDGGCSDRAHAASSAKL